MKLLLLSAFVCLSLNSIAQTDTVFLDRNNQEVSRDSARYFELPAEKLENGLYLIKSYYISNGRLHSEQTFKDKEGNVGQGYIRNFYENGIKKDESNFENGKVEGVVTQYRTDGTIWHTAEFKDDEFHGNSIRYYLTGKVKSIERYKHGKYKGGKYYNSNGQKTKYFEDNCCPEAPVGYKSYYEYIRKNIKLPPNFKSLPKGKVIMDVYFNEKGLVDYVEFEKKLHPVLDEEAKRLMLAMPVWGPAKDDFGEPKEFSRSLTVDFF